MKRKFYELPSGKTIDLNLVYMLDPAKFKQKNDFHSDVPDRLLIHYEVAGNKEVMAEYCKSFESVIELKKLIMFEINKLEY